MKKKILVILSYIILFFNSNVLSNEENKILKIGLLAPLSGEYEELGNSLLYSLQLALNEIDDKNVIIIPRDAGFNNKILLGHDIYSKNRLKKYGGHGYSHAFESLLDRMETIGMSKEKINDIITLNPQKILTFE